MADLASRATTAGVPNPPSPLTPTAAKNREVRTHADESAINGVRRGAKENPGGCWPRTILRTPRRSQRCSAAYAALDICGNCGLGRWLCGCHLGRALLCRGSA